jgi:hypothetical protein
MTHGGHLGRYRAGTLLDLVRRIDPRRLLLVGLGAEAT